MKTVRVNRTTATLLMAGAANAAEVEVKLLNKDTEGMMVFEPALVKIARATP
jgi:hypothetical protein